MGRLNPRRETKIQDKKRDSKKGIIEKVTEKRKLLARKRMQRGKAERCLLSQRKTRNPGRAREQKIPVAAHNVRTMAVDGRHGVGRALDF